MINTEQGISIMVPRISGQTRHENWERTVNRRKLYHAMMTGDDIEEYLTRFACREDEDQFAMRKAITQQCVSPAVNEAGAKFYKTSRYPNIKKEISYENDSKKLPKLEAALNQFCYQGDVQSYLAMEYDRRSLIDPNAFLVIDFGAFDAMQNQKPGSYGVFIPCDCVVDFEFLPNDELNWLVIEREIQIYDKDSNVIKLKDYIGYLGNDIVVFEHYHEDRKDMRGKLIASGADEYRYYTLSVKAGQVQAFRIGYIKDPITNFKTMVSPLDLAETVVMDLNNDKSEYDMTKRFHVFPQKFQFAERCPGLNAIVTCSHGQTPEGTTCTKCKGQGVVIHTSSSDIITMPMPKDKEQYFMPLADLVHYAKPDIEIIQHLREDLDASRLAIMRAIFTTQSAVKTDGNVKLNNTATEFTIKADDENNILLPFCEHKSKAFKFIVRQIALFNDIADGLKVLFEYPASLRFESIEELQAMFSQLVTSGASPTLLDDLEVEIASKRFVDDSAGLIKYNVWRIHRPFRNRPSEETQFSIGSGYSPKWVEVLWANYENIMTEMENENKSFYSLDYKGRHELIKARAQEYVAELEPAVPVKTGFLGKGESRQEEDLVA